MVAARIPQRQGFNPSGIIVGRFLGQYLIPTKIHLLNPDTTDKIFNTHEPNFTERTEFDDGIVGWKAKWAQVYSEDKPTTLQHTRDGGAYFEVGGGLKTSARGASW